MQKGVESERTGYQDPELPISSLIYYSTFPYEVSNLWAECSYQSCLQGSLLCNVYETPAEGRGVLGLIFAGYCAAGLSESLPHYSLFYGHIVDPILVTLGNK